MVKKRQCRVAFVPKSSHSRKTVCRPADTYNCVKNNQFVWMTDGKWIGPAGMFSVALVARLLAIPTSLERINPYSQADAIGFMETAQFIARELSLASPRSTTYETWGAVIAPFWFLPGPSRIYALVFVALLGALSVYNVAVIGQKLHSRQVGILAALPIAIYPSIVLIQSTLLREAAVLFGLTTAARLLIAQSPKLPRNWSFVGATLALGFATILRTDNFPVYVLAIASAVVVRYWYSRLTKATLGAGIITGSVVLESAIPIVLRRFNVIRSRRAEGRTEYLGWIRFDGIAEMIVFSWIGSVYFLFTPFPWMVETLEDVPVAVEAVGNLCYAIAAIWGFRYLVHRNTPVAIGLAVGLFLGTILYGFGTVNYGTAVRHRPMFLWVVFLFGSVGIASWIGQSSIDN